MMFTSLSPFAAVLIVVVVYMLVDLHYQSAHEAPPAAPTEKHTRRPWRRLTSSSLSFRKVGFLTSRELADSVILPLFGEIAPYRRHRWNYYTVTDTHQSLSSVKLPVLHKERSCVDEVACEELYSGDIVRVHGYESPFTVHVY